MSKRFPVKKMFCWQCGKALNYRHGQPMFAVVTLPGGNEVKTHMICVQGAKDNTKFATTPRSPYLYGKL